MKQFSGFYHIVSSIVLIQNVKFIVSDNMDDNDIIKIWNVKKRKNIRKLIYHGNPIIISKCTVNNISFKIYFIISGV